MGFHVALRKLGIRHAAVGFSADHRWPLVVHRVFMGFEHSLKPHAWWTLANGPDRQLGEQGALNARDGYSLRWGARWLARQPEQRKILIFLSDGEVNHEWKPNVPPELRDRYSYEWGQGVGAKDTRQTVRDAERLGVTVIGVSIDPTWGYMEQIYPRRICCTDIRELPDALARILGQVMVAG